MSIWQHMFYVIFADCQFQR